MIKILNSFYKMAGDQCWIDVDTALMKRGQRAWTKSPQHTTGFISDLFVCVIKNQCINNCKSGSYPDIDHGVRCSVALCGLNIAEFCLWYQSRSCMQHKSENRVVNGLILFVEPPKLFASSAATPFVTVELLNIFFHVFKHEGFSPQLLWA